MLECSSNVVNTLNEIIRRNVVVTRVTRGALVSHRYTYASPLCRTSQYTAGLLLPSQCLPSLNDLDDPLFEGGGLEGFKSWAMPFYWPSCSLPFVPSDVFPS